MNVKKNDQDTSLFEKELNNQNLYSESFKTTNVNVLLNRVRLDKKKSFRKNIIVSLAIVSVFIAIITYFLI